MKNGFYLRAASCGRWPHIRIKNGLQMFLCIQNVFAAGSAWLKICQLFWILLFFYMMEGENAEQKLSVMP